MRGRDVFFPFPVTFRSDPSCVLRVTVVWGLQTVALSTGQPQAVLVSEVFLALSPASQTRCVALAALRQQGRSAHRARSVGTWPSIGGGHGSRSRRAHSKAMRGGTRAGVGNTGKGNRGSAAGPLGPRGKDPAHWPSIGDSVSREAAGMAREPDADVTGSPQAWPGRARVGGLVLGAGVGVQFRSFPAGQMLVCSPHVGLQASTQLPTEPRAAVSTRSCLATRSQRLLQFNCIY